MAGTDFFQDSPNFINPDYVTDAQRKQLRAYSDMLMKRSSGDIQRPTGAIANMIDALTGRLEMNRAGNLEQQALSKSTDQQAALIAALQQPQQPQQDAQVGGGAVASLPPAATNAQAPASVTATPPMGKVNPIAADAGSPNAIVADRFAPAYDAIAKGDFDPQGINSMLSRPPIPPVRVASLSPGGAGAPAGPQEQPPVLPTAGAPATPGPMPIQPVKTAQLDPRLMSGILNNQMSSPEAKAMISQLIGQKVGEDVYGNPSVTSIIGGARNLPQSNGYTPGYRAPEGAGGASTVSPIIAPGVGRPQAVGPAPGSFADRIAPIAKAGRDQAAEAERTTGGAKAEGTVIENDVKAAAQAPLALKDLGLLRDTIKTNGDNMTFGPTAKFSNEAMRVISNYAPNLVDQKALAGSDAVEKLNLSLAGRLSGQLGLNPSDISRSIGSVPGNEKSKAGTLALIDMLEQQARNDAYVGGPLYQQYKDNLGGYQQARTDYYNAHPIRNPITNNPIKLDAESQKQGSSSSTGGSRIIKVHE